MSAYQDRKFVMFGIVAVLGFIFIIRLFFIQVLDDTYKLNANNNVLRYKTDFPARGTISDRNGKLLVINEPAYDIMVIPRQVKSIDTLDFCNLLNISKEVFIETITKARKYSQYKPSVFANQFTAKQYARIQEKLYKYPGFYGQRRTLRYYLYNSASHLLGYVGEVNEKIIDENPYYKSGDYIGISGLERSYEEPLRGKKGVRVVMVDVHNREKGSFKNGFFDTIAISGKNVISSIDIDIQRYGEELMQNKKGSIVAIEPSTGEILCMVTTPGYDPSLLVGRERAKNYQKLSKDSLKPLFNRAMMSQYPPGSIFKIAQSLVALQQGVINLNTGFPCNKSLVGCHPHPPAGNVEQAIKMSCNPYFFMVFRKMIERNQTKSRFKDAELGLADWREHMLTFGFGQKLGIDLPGEKGGLLPGVKLYDKIYGDDAWAFSTIYSVSIGQGEVLVVPTQMANLAAIIANRGFYYPPHIIKNIEGDSIANSQRFQKHTTSVDSKYFEPVVEAMRQVVEVAGGTARQARIEGITVCGKTGTAENPHGEDHSVFICFAPKDNPKIAMAVYVENAGFGGTWAAPIASLIMEKYLKGEVKRKELEERMLAANLMNVKKKKKKDEKRRRRNF
jgi:penicillin-binding protein 2